jgi:hypothetical protein
MLWALMKHAFYVMNQFFEECNVSGKIYRVQFGHHVKSLQHSNLSTDSIYSKLHQICQVLSNINMLTDTHTHTHTQSHLINFKHILCTATTISST